MSYQKLNTSRAWKVNTNDDTPLPNIGGATTILGVLDLGTPVIGNNLNFTPAFEPFSQGVVVGMVVVNVTTGAQTVVTGVNQSANLTQVTVDNTTAFNAGDEIVIYDAVTSRSAAVLYVGTGGNVRVLTAGGDDVVIVGVAAATFIPINVVQVLATDTTAADILALW